MFYFNCNHPFLWWKKKFLQCDSFLQLITVEPWAYCLFMMLLMKHLSTVISFPDHIQIILIFFCTYLWTNAWEYLSYTFFSFSWPFKFFWYFSVFIYGLMHESFSWPFELCFLLSPPSPHSLVTFDRLFVYLGWIMCTNESVFLWLSFFYPFFLPFIFNISCFYMLRY